MKIFRTTQIRNLDAYTIEHEPIASIDLMERAAQALNEALTERYPDTKTPFVFFAGPGNNGGDALAVARLMGERGYRPTVYLFNTKGHLSPDCEENSLRLLEAEGVTLHEVTSQFIPPQLNADTVVVDGLFGSGLNKPLEGGFAAVVRYINANTARVIAIDVPSGLFGEDNSTNKEAHIIRASLTLSLQLPKLAFLFAENEKFVGEWQLLDIGLSSKAIEQEPTDFRLTEEADVRSLIRPRGRFSHKGTYGRGLLIAGSQGMAGASVLAARACLRSGVGLLTVHVPLCNQFILQTSVPEAMTEMDADDFCFTTPADTEGYTAVAIGPGLGKAEATVAALLQQIDEADTPLVLDADALNILADHRAYLHRLPAGSILTPHPKELERIVGRCENSYERLERARHLAEECHVTVVLKGAFTAVIMPEGNVCFNPTGNPGMATGGSGDVLTGILLALLAQGYSGQDAALLGVYLHGLAGDMAAQRLGETSMNAGDLITHLPPAWRYLTE